jgi:hypothetical protein
MSNTLRTTVNDFADVRRALAAIDERLAPSRWMPYTPAWTAAVTDPAIGDGFLEGYFTRTHDLCMLSVEMTAGPTTSFGSGVWFFGLPAPARTPVAVFGSGYLLGATLYLCVPHVSVVDGGRKLRIVTDGPGFNVGPTVPFTWAQGDQLKITLAYPVQAG